MSISLHEAITQRLATDTGLTLGTDLFWGHIPPEEADLAVAILERVPMPRDGYNNNFRKHRFQVFGRGPSFKTGKDRTALVNDALIAKTFRGIQLTDWYLYFAVGEEVMHLGKDERDRFEFTANATATARVGAPYGAT